MIDKTDLEVHEEEQIAAFEADKLPVETRHQAWCDSLKPPTIVKNRPVSLPCNCGGIISDPNIGPLGAAAVLRGD